MLFPCLGVMYKVYQGDVDLSRSENVRLRELADVLDIVDVLDAFCDRLVLVK